MARTDATLIGTIIAVNPDLSLTGPIRAANVLVNNVVTCAAENDTTLTDETLQEMETFLAAHIYAFRDPQYVQKQTEKSSATFQVRVGLRLDSTQWGQMALALDTSGCLSKFNTGSKTVGGFWAGKPVSEQIEYELRD